MGAAPHFEPPLEPGGAGGSSAAVTGLRARRRGTHDGRSPRTPAPPTVCFGAAGEGDCAAARFADRSLRLVLEVIDGRRPAGQLRSVVEPTVLAAVETLARTAAAERRLGSAVLVTVKISEITAYGAEVFAGYDRGPRRFAIAARLVLRRGRWRVGALRMR
ncbi:Rv3235 family protein [Nocardia sp. NPDC052254]|uniref:Rv3235 family protein n=1 Tax=Nocardia sp. NPDC052254 TaxID=3155681 RepID=UPI00343FF1A8